MNTKSLQVFVAVAIGVFLGLLGAWKLMEQLGPAWWLLAYPVGVIGGGSTAYVFYDPRGVVRGIIVAFRKTWHDVTAPEVWRRIRLLSLPLFYALMGVYLVTLWTMPFLLFLVLVDDKKGPPVIGWLVFQQVFCLFACYIVVLFTAGFTYENLKTQNEQEVLRKLHEGTTHLFKYLNPFVVLFWWVPKGIVLFLPRFLRNLFIAIHSEARLICFLDAALFVAGSFCFHNSMLVALTAGLVGGCFGAAHYKVAIRYLPHIQPA
jgi:hypothetical protein